MRKIFPFFYVLLWSCQLGPIQIESGTWQLAWEPAEEAHLRAIYFADNWYGWAVGDSGSIIHTADGGQSWSQQASGSSSHLNAIYFVNQQTGWIAGDDNTLLYTTNGGQNWYSQAPVGDSSRIFTDLFFADELTGWTVHTQGGLLHTQDGGVTWEVQANWETGGTALLSFVNSQIGFAKPLTQQYLLKTTDGGQHWIPVSLSITPWVRDMLFIDEQHGWIASNKEPT